MEWLSKLFEGLRTESHLQPGIDWSRIKTEEDFSPKLDQRNQYPADIIKTEILAKGKKALVIYGEFHLYGEKSLRGLVEHDYPGTFLS